MLVLSILQNMWHPFAGDRWKAPIRFRINPLNYSGKRLYNLVGEGSDLWVTNASRQVSRRASDSRTKVDLESLDLVLTRYPWDLVLVCGRVAQAAARRLDPPISERGVRYLEIDHPAARRWTKEKITEVAAMIQS